MSKKNIEKMDGWTKIVEFSVGGFLWIGFSKHQTNKVICISSEYASSVNCDTGEIIECDADYDEETYIAICECFQNEEIDIYGQYGGYPILRTPKGECISNEVQEELFGDKVVTRHIVHFITPETNIEIYNDYGYYVCSFSLCGNYFVLADDAGVTVMKRR